MKDINTNIEFNRLIGEMAGTLQGILLYFSDSIPDAQKGKIADVLKKYEEFFKNGK